MQLPALNKIIICATLLLLAACAEKTTPPFTGVKIGKPYEINGKTYRPAPDPTYDKIGDASWYGPGFHGKRTASGEVFDQNDITAAHPTLPLPSLVRVTNLSNDKSIVVRLNDRGPYHSNRIIDLSKRSAEIINIRGTKPVRVQFLAQETDEYLASIKGASPRIDMVAYNESYNEKMEKGKEEVQIANVDLVRPEADNNVLSDNRIVENFAPLQTVTISDLDKPIKPGIKARNFLISDAEASELPPQTTPVLQRENTNISQPHTQQPNTLQVPQQKTVAAKETSKDKFIILAGSFKSESNARKLSNSLVAANSHESNISVDRVELDGKNWWRVHIGPFFDRAKAEKSLDFIHKMGLIDARISSQK